MNSNIIKKYYEKHFEDNPASEFVYVRTYAKWREDLGRREFWPETVERFINFLLEERGNIIPPKILAGIKEYVEDMKVMPSMRALWSAGPAAKVDNLTMYNCSFVAVDSLEVFGEAIYALMCGTGIGFSVEDRFVSKLPVILEHSGIHDGIYQIEDSRIGWKKSVDLLFKSYYQGHIVDFDYSKLRPRGALLKTMGGKSSGPDPLRSLHQNIKGILIAAQGRKLTDIECHDIMCRIGEIVVVGGVRRCLPQNTLIHTEDRGLIRIKDIVVGEKVLTHKNQYRKVLALVNAGERDLITIKTQMGDFYSASNHRWAVLDDLNGNYIWVRADELTKDDRLIIVPHVLPGKTASLPDFVWNESYGDTNSKDLVIPELDTDIAWFFGQLHGDGYIYLPDRKKIDSSAYTSIACSDDLEGQLTKVKKCFTKFGFEASIPGVKKERCEKPRVVSIKLATYLDKFKHANESIIVPDFILQSTPDIRAAYLAGIFDADGYCNIKNEKKILPTISSVYPDYLYQLRTLFFSLGVNVKIKLHKKDKNRWKNLYVLTPIGIDSTRDFYKVLDPFSLKINKNPYQERYFDVNTFTIPKNLLRKYKKRNLFNNSLSNVKHKGELSFSLFKSTVDENIEYIPVKVLETVFEGKTDITYDIQVEDNECFVADGLLTHNTALISFSDLNSVSMRHAKDHPIPPHRFMSNNSAVYESKPSMRDFIQEWGSLAKSGSGERGIANFGNISKFAERRNVKDHVLRGNPCMEAMLRSRGLCNLTEVVARDTDSFEDLLDKIKIAVWIGAIQSTFTYFPHFNSIWKENAEEERLLGVSITGQMDNLSLFTEEKLEIAKKYAIKVAKKAAKILGINVPAQVTLGKPSGTVSQLVNSSSGVHTRYAKFFIRRYRISSNDSLVKVLRYHGIKLVPDNGQTEETVTTYVVEFPVKTPEKSLTRNDLDVIAQLEHYKKVQTKWCEGNASTTIYVKEDEWLKAGAWVYDNFEDIVGIAFLPYDGGIYKLAPYEEIDEETYEKMKASFPAIDYSLLSQFEREEWAKHNGNGSHSKEFIKTSLEEGVVLPTVFECGDKKECSLN